MQVGGRLDAAAMMIFSEVNACVEVFAASHPFGPASFARLPGSNRCQTELI